MDTATFIQTLDNLFTFNIMLIILSINSTILLLVKGK